MGPPALLPPAGSAACTMWSPVSGCTGRLDPSCVAVGATELGRQHHFPCRLPKRARDVYYRHTPLAATWLSTAGHRTRGRKSSSASWEDSHSDSNEDLWWEESVPSAANAPTSSLSEDASVVGTSLGGRYRVVSLLGRGSAGITYEAEAPDGRHVAVKELSLRGMRSWKELELFEREAATLRSLSHPGIPEYIDSFEEDTATNRRFFLVQRMAAGESLAQLVARGMRFTDGQAVDLMLQILSVLQYLESLRPPVVHRDIKPDNIVYDPVTGVCQLVDFGGVQKVAVLAGGAPLGSTVVGTYGFMSPEQFQNRATTQSDLYSLGATMLYLLSGGAPPSSFPQVRLRIDFRSALPNLSPGLASVLDGLLQPAPEDRFRSASVVIGRLQRLKAEWESPRNGGAWPGGGTPTSPVGSTPSSLGFPWGPALPAPSSGLELDRLPAGSRLEVEETPGRLSVQIPPTGLNSATIGTGSFAVAWNAFVAFWTASAATAGAPLLFTAFSIPFWVVGAGLAKSVVGNILVSVVLDVDHAEFEIRWRVADLWSHSVKGRTADLSAARVVAVEVQNGRPLLACELQEGVRCHHVGAGLSQMELQWIARHVSRFLPMHRY